jgi:NitT/TauT family transport system ATP-binding protein
MNAAISVKNLRKSFKNTQVFQDFNLEVPEKKITAIFGPNGSGKSTLLNILAGITAKNDGEYSLKGADRFSLSYIFQNYRGSLLPWRTNFENIALPLEIQKQTKKQIQSKVKELQKLFQFDFNWDSYPYQLSGGQQQILAFLRALVTDPKILFIDEPFSALDYENNLRLREHLQKYYLTFKPTILLVTHDIEEAVHLGDRIIIFSQKPTKVLASIDNPLPYPRNLTTLKTKEFHAVKDKVLSVFQKAVNL